MSRNMEQSVCRPDSETINNMKKLPEGWWNHIRPIPYKELLTKKILAKKQQSVYSREQAIKMAEPYHLEQEVTDAIDTYGLSPDEALQDWDLYPYDSKL